MNHLRLLMTQRPISTVQLNGVDYVVADLSLEAQRLVALIQQGQAEVGRLQAQLALIQAGQQQLLGQLTPLLPATAAAAPKAVAAVSGAGLTVQGSASDQIPTSSVQRPAEQPAPFPEVIPASILAS